MVIKSFLSRVSQDCCVLTLADVHLLAHSEPHTNQPRADFFLLYSDLFFSPYSSQRFIAISSHFRDRSSRCRRGRPLCDALSQAQDKVDVQQERLLLTAQGNGGHDEARTQLAFEKQAQRESGQGQGQRQGQGHGQER